jgi:hypothetical protein
LHAHELHARELHARELHARELQFTFRIFILNFLALTQKVEWKSVPNQ